MTADALRAVAEAAWADIEAGYDEELEQQRQHDRAAFDESFDPPTVLALLDVAEAAKRYRQVLHADPTSLDRPPAGSNLDRALARLEEA